MVCGSIFRGRGKTEKEAINNLREALELYFEDEPKQDLAKIEHPKLQSFSFSLNA